MTTTARHQTETVVMLPVDECHTSPSQPRRRSGEKLDDDFVASIREKGVLQPIIVRSRKAGGHEIVFGHRRHKGSVLAKRESIPAIVRVMTDDEVFEAQLIENIHREDMHPLDEADGFKRLLERGRTVQDIAGKIGRPSTYVAQRLKLCELGKECRAALDKEDISLSVAVYIARVPASLQAEALRSLWHGIGASEAKRKLEDTYLLRLDQAPFDIADTNLVAKAGACTVCPKRTGQQRELFPDAARADMCIDRVCYRSKLDEVWKIRRAEAKAGGKQVLEGKAAAAAIGFGSAYKSMDSEQWDGSNHRKVRAIMGKDKPPTVLARDENTGAIVELVKATDIAKVLKQRSPQSSVNTRSGVEKRQEAQDRRRAAAITLAVTTAVDAVKRLSPLQLLRLIVHALIERSWNENQQAIVRRRGLDAKDVGTKTHGAVLKSRAEVRLLAHLKTLTKADDVGALGLELALRTIAPGKWSPSRPLWGETLKALGINFDAIERKLAADAKAKAKPKAKAKAKAA